MDGKRKLPTDQGFYTPNEKKDRQHEPEGSNYGTTETPDSETKIEFTTPVKVEDDLLAVKFEAKSDEKYDKFEQNTPFVKGVILPTPQEQISPVNHGRIKTEHDNSLRDIREKYCEIFDHPGNFGMVKKVYTILTSSIDGRKFLLDHLTGQLIKDYNRDDDVHSEIPQFLQQPNERYEDGIQHSQPSGRKPVFKLSQPSDQEPTTSKIPAEKQVQCAVKSSLNSFGRKSAEPSNNEYTASQTSVSISSLLDHPFTSGFWNIDQQDRILTDPIPFSGDDGAKKSWLDQFSSYPWLCRSDQLLKFFCWPCLLFGDPISIWSVDSSLLVNSNLHYFNSTYLKNHQATNQHQEAELLYITKKNIVHALKPKPIHDQENWKHLVRAICSERKSKFVFENTIDFESKTTPAMRYILPKMINATVAFKLSKVILAIATHHMKMKIINDVRKAQYVVLHIEELSPIVRNGSWLVAIARYADQDGHVRERVIEFFETLPIKTGRSDDVSVAWIKHLFEDYKLNENVIGISYSATLVVPKDILLFNNKLLKWCPRTLFFHPPAHSFYKSFLQAMSHSAFCRKYLQELHKICKFLTKYAAIFLFEQSNNSSLPKTFDSNFQAKFKSYFPVLIDGFRRVEMSSGYRKETRKEASKYLKFLNTVENCILMIIIDRVCSSVAKLADAVDGTFHLLDGNFRALTDLRKESITNLDNIIKNSIRYIAEDELLATDIPDDLKKKYENPIRFTIQHGKEFLLQGFPNWEPLWYANSKLLECSLDGLKFPNDPPMKQLDLDEPASIQLQYFLKPQGSFPWTSNKSLTEILSCLARDKSQHEYPGLLKFLQFVHTVACDKRTSRNVLNSVYSFTEIKSPEDLTTAYLDGYFWQVEDISALIDDPDFYRTALEACQLKIAKM